MSVVVEREEWLLSCLIYGFLFACCFFSVFLLPYFSQSGRVTSVTTTASSFFDVGPTAPILRFQKSFLLLFSLASVMEGLESIYGEYDFAYHGMSREQMVLIISAGVAISVVLGTFIGILSDIIGPRNFCILFSLFHFLVGVLKRVNWYPSMLLSSLCIGIASTAYSFCFETWMVIEHEKQDHMIDVLSDTFWLMILFESASLLVCQGLANLFTKDLQKVFLSRSALVALLAIISICYIRKECNGNRQKATIENYQKSFTGHILAGPGYWYSGPTFGTCGGTASCSCIDKRIWMLGWAQASVHFSVSLLDSLGPNHSGRWEGSAAVAYISMFPWFKNAWKHSLSMVF